MTIDTVFNSLRVSWDAPYRLLASLLSIGCVCAQRGLMEASSPLDALRRIASYLGADAVSEVILSIAEWLATRSEVVEAAAFLLLLAGVVFNQGDGSGRATIPGPWRGAPTALIALTAYWQVNPHGIPLLLGVGFGLLLVTAVLAAGFKWSSVGLWLIYSVLNLVTSVVFILVIPLWMISRSRPQTQEEQRNK